MFVRVCVLSKRRESKSSGTRDMMAASYPMWVLATKLGSHVRAEGTKERLHGEGLGTGCLIIHYCFSTCEGFTCSWCRRYNLRAHKPSEHNCCSTPREARALRAEPPGAVTDREHEQPGTGCAPSPQCCSHYWCLPLSCVPCVVGMTEGRLPLTEFSAVVSSLRAVAMA